MFGIVCGCFNCISIIIFFVKKTKKQQQNTTVLLVQLSSMIQIDKRVILRNSIIYRYNRRRIIKIDSCFGLGKEENKI